MHKKVEICSNSDVVIIAMLFVIDAKDLQHEMYMYDLFGGDA